MACCRRCRRCCRCRVPRCWEACFRWLRRFPFSVWCSWLCALCAFSWFHATSSLCPSRPPTCPRHCCQCCCPRIVGLVPVASAVPRHAAQQRQPWPDRWCLKCRSRNFGHNWRRRYLALQAM
ncbi:hypothetical protein D3878_15435 [Noviherbaspirillum sedimenti]|uniref:Uncharacterized protein n=1 Tax=Noviherbaspirillum sedimenti TaxID=2320865 RepID=A0A3A3GP95_9BURK|nr:hypothetical protein D3878_15435 [Noviherbaspirillum sedimenti]